MHLFKEIQNAKLTWNYGYIAREANLPLNLMTEKDTTDSDHEVSDAKYVRNLENNLREIHQFIEGHYEK